MGNVGSVLWLKTEDISAAAASIWIIVFFLNLSLVNLPTLQHAILNPCCAPLIFCYRDV